MLQKSKIILIVGGIIILGALAYATRSAQETKRLKDQLAQLQQTQQQASPDEVKKLVETVGRLIVLPEGEEPTVATVSDQEKLKDTPFFAKAENDDKVLIYVDSKKAILYRPSTEKIIEVATINLSTAAAAANQNFAPKVALRNGTSVAGLTRTFEEDLKKGLPKVEITSRDNSANTARTSTIVIDLNGDKSADAGRLAAAIGARVEALPAGESKPSGADFLILIGSDKSTATPATSPAPAPVSSPSPAE